MYQKNPKISFIIRTKNEEENIDECLERVFSQSERDFEVIVVDSGSKDKTLEIVRKYPIRLFEIKSEDFTFPFALNYGAEKSLATDFLVIISAHCFIPNDKWLENGLKNFYDSQVAGVYGPVWASQGARSSFWEKVFFSKFFDDIRIRFSFWQKKKVSKSKMGVLGFTNAIIRKNLWEKRKFNEAFGLGGEDSDWAEFWFRRGYFAIRDINFGIYHSHKLSLWNLWKQRSYWQSVSKPQKFSLEKVKKHRGNSSIFEK